MKLTFVKNEKLKSKKSIEALFTDGQSFVCHPIRIVYKINDKTDYNQRVGVSVAKKKFKKAVDRNLLKRRIKEAYRLNKPILDNKNYSIDILFIYTSTQIKNYQTINSAMIDILTKLNENITKKGNL